MKNQSPNIVFVFGDQWRAQATGYAGDSNAVTPNLDALERESLHFRRAVSGCPVCSPYRASLMTGQRPLTHGVFMNDVPLNPRGTCLAEAFSEAGYATAYIGKWHIDGHGRSNYIPPERRRGFAYWKVLECTHDYNNSAYYSGDSDEKRLWEGYDAIAQTRDAGAWIRNADRDRPFLMMLSWGPPHAPYGTAPVRYRERFSEEAIVLAPNVPESMAENARKWLAGYYAHIAALDDCVGELLAVLDECGLAEDTIFVFTSDHGDMLGSQGEVKKQRPWEESIRVPFLLRYPKALGRRPGTSDIPIDAQDIMPTLLGLCGVPTPAGVEGIDFSGPLLRGENPEEDAVLLVCAQPFGQFQRGLHHGREYRGLRTARYTYVRDLNGPWLCYDNDADPWQLRNRVGDPRAEALIRELDARLDRKLAEVGDAFLPGEAYLEKWGYEVDETGTVPYRK